MTLSAFEVRSSSPTRPLPIPSSSVTSAKLAVDTWGGFDNYEAFMTDLSAGVGLAPVVPAGPARLGLLRMRWTCGEISYLSSFK